MTHNIVSIFGGHDANITFYNSTTKKYHIIEIERLTGERYFQLKKNSSDYVKDILEQCQIIATNFWGIKNEYDTLLIDARWKKRGIPDVICQVFNTKNVKTISLILEADFQYSLPRLYGSDSISLRLSSFIW